MGFTPPGAGNRFSSIDQRTAYAVFKASGSFDPDALYARKEAMLAPYRILKRLAAFGAFAGSLIIVVLGMAVLGIAVIGVSFFLWRYQAGQVRNIEAGYAQYVGAEPT